MRSLRVLLVAEEAAGLRALELMAASPHALVAACTSGTGEAGGSSVAGRARALDVPLLPAELVAEEAFAAQVRADGIDLLLNVHSLRIAHPAVIAAPRLGAFNLHPGPLPEYAGLSVPSWAIYNGERSHAVTLHEMDAEVDAGSVAFEERFAIDEGDTGLTVSAAATRLGVPLIGELLDVAAGGGIPSRAQDLSRRRWYPRSGPHEGRVPWGLPARRIVDFVRASDYSPLASPWGAPLARGSRGDVEVLRASPTGEPAAAAPGTVVRADGDAVAVAAADELVLITRVRADDRSAAPASALVPGELLDPGPNPVPAVPG